MRPHTQDGGGPTADDDPAIQIERLALWDGGSEKLVQVNHPDIGWMFRDRNGDGTAGLGLCGHVRPHGRHRGPPAPPDLRRPDRSSSAGRRGTTRSSTGSSSSTRAGASRRGQYRRPLQLPRVGLVAELPQEPDRRPGRDPDARRGSCRRARALGHVERAVPRGRAPRTGGSGASAIPGRRPGRSRAARRPCGSGSSARTGSTWTASRSSSTAARPNRSTSRDGRRPSSSRPRR